MCFFSPCIFAAFFYAVLFSLSARKSVVVSDGIFLVVINRILFGIDVKLVLF